MTFFLVLCLKLALGFFFNAASLPLFFFFIIFSSNMRLEFLQVEKQLYHSAQRKRGDFSGGEAVNERGNEPDL